MKSIICIVQFILVLIFISCSSTNLEPTTKRVIVAGKVINPDPLVNKINLSINRIGIGNEQISPTLDEKGNFKIIFESYTPLDAWLRYKTSFLIVTHPGDSIYLEFDGSEKEREIVLETLTFSGDASQINTKAATFQKMLTQNRSIEYFKKNEKAIKIYSGIDYKNYRDSVKNVENNLLKGFILKYNPDNELLNWARIYLDVEYYKDLVSYPQIHRITNNLNYQDIHIPISYYDCLKNHFKINDSILISSYALSSFVNMYPVYLQEKIKHENIQLFNSPGYFKEHPEAMDSLRFYSTIKYIEDSLLKQMVLTEILYQSLEQSNPRIFTKYKSKISGIVTEPYLRQPLFDLYNQTIKNIKDPKQASNAILKKLNGAVSGNDIKKIIENNKGKVIYLDCWATWCGPCISEFKNAKTLMKDYKADQLAFIFICLDSEEKNWKATLSNHSLGGQHYFLNKDQSSEFRNIFNIEGVPHYILFDKKGNIANNQAQSPGFIKDEIDQLLTKK